MSEDSAISTVSFESLEEFRLQALKKITRAGNSQKLENLRIEILGRKSAFHELLASLSKLSIEEKRQQGPRLNNLRQELESAFDAREKELARSVLKVVRDGREDLTLPGRPSIRGARHPLALVTERILSVFERLGFRYVEGREVELDENNFTMLNIPDDHPARDMHDTLYLKSNEYRARNIESKAKDPSERPSRLLLRTHTTPVWIAVMRGAQPPYRIVTTGKVFRSEAVDATHLPGFSQIDAFYMDQDCSMNDLKATLEIWAAELFGSQTQVRFRPSYFPFTEPSCEVELRCFVCSGPGCSTCKKTGWIELLGAGMIHPGIIKRMGHDPERWRGFAFGLGVERVAMALWGVSDIRFFYENDIEFLKQFQELR